MAGAGGRGGEIPRTESVAYNDSDPAYYSNTEAIRDAHKVGTEHEIKELQELDSDKLKRSRGPSDAPFVLCPSPPRTAGPGEESIRPIGNATSNGNSL